ncbi:MAG: SET domain-containing protein-lysine N-methyltransferase [Actinomycetota bacterium]
MSRHPRAHSHDLSTTDHLLVPVEVRSLGSVGDGVFLTAPVSQGTPIAVFGGRAVPGDVFRLLPESRQRHALQVHDDVYLVGDVNPTVGDLVNHSCDPTGLLVGQIVLVASRDLDAGEELTFDYATCDSTSYDEFECECGTARCRGKVTANDWMEPAVRKQYAGHFSPYLATKIARLERDEADSIADLDEAV